MSTETVLPGLASIAGIIAVLLWARRIDSYDATVLVPRSMPCLKDSDSTRPSDDWTDEQLDRMADALESDEDEIDGSVLHFDRRPFLAGRDPGDERDEHDEGFV